MFRTISVGVLGTPMPAWKDVLSYQQRRLLAQYVMALSPRFLTELLQGVGFQRVKLTFYKYGHMGVYIESRRGTGAWEMLGIDTDSPYSDERPLLAAGQPEVREYRMRFWDKGTPNGDWTDVAKVTVSP